MEYSICHTSKPADIITPKCAKAQRHGAARQGLSNGYNEEFENLLVFELER